MLKKMPLWGYIAILVACTIISFVWYWWDNEFSYFAFEEYYNQGNKARIEKVLVGLSIILFLMLLHYLYTTFFKTSAVAAYKNQQTMNDQFKKRFQEATEVEMPELIADLQNYYEQIPSHQRGSFNQLTSEFSDRPANFTLGGWKSKLIVLIGTFKFEIADSSRLAASATTANVKTANDNSNVLKTSTVVEDAADSYANDIFISYSHHAEDKPYFDEIKRQLASLKSYGLADVHIWDDTQIRTGDDWLHEIETALAKTKVAVLLVSPNFLASPFITNSEVPAFLANVQKNGGKIMSVILRKTLFSMHPTLGKYQSANSPEKPLNALTEVEKDEVYVKLLGDIVNFYKQA